MKQAFDKYPWLIFIIIIGVYLIFRKLGIMPDILAKSENEFYAVLFNQIVLGLGLGIIALIAGFKINYKFWKK